MAIDRAINRPTEEVKIIDLDSILYIFDFNKRFTMYN